jgi:hypothetical protein
MALQSILVQFALDLWAIHLEDRLTYIVQEVHCPQNGHGSDVQFAHEFDFRRVDLGCIPRTIPLGFLVNHSEEVNVSNVRIAGLLSKVGAEGVCVVFEKIAIALSWGTYLDNLTREVCMNSKDMAIDSGDTFTRYVKDREEPVTCD